ncbi:hypothetical protein ABZ622_34860 [Streptomyces sp. NPDC007164]|uniref:hypothetical protein n=1 Tax=Streptomyces sp. NPDC007164 TaxID=3156918 RepID=UPI00340207A6
MALGAWTDYRDPLVRAHFRLGGPITVGRDNLSTHRAAGMMKYAAEHDWLGVFQLPSSAPDLIPVAGVRYFFGAARRRTPPSRTQAT